MGKLKIASLFCGCGGTDVGLLGGFEFLGKFYAKNDVEIVYANDIDDSACKLFELNFNLIPDSRDIREIDSVELPDFDILTGGFPCQSFSIIAQNPKRLGVKDERGKLFFEMCRILKEKQPKCFIAENVKGILSANKGSAFPLILEEFENSGYNVSYKLLNSADFGVPQKRERVIIIGFRNDLNIDFEFPDEVITSEENYIPLSEVITDVAPQKYFFSEKAVQGMLRRRESMNKGRAQDITKPCNTVGAHLAKVSLNSTDPVLLENGRYRRFTPREVARIQSFPEEFILEGSETSQYKALGNAIPPVMLWHVAKEVIQELENIEEREPRKQIKRRVLPRIDALINYGLVEVGDVVIPKGRNDKGILLENGKVLVKGYESTIHTWLKEVYEKPSIDTYNHIVHIKSGKTLYQIREEYVNS
ncbi:MAG: DNA (cytosine-5-)-methyltransferase [Clostridiaceae bacterium]|nr:DNA (cytosine-5-)-methyltransferase [Clostridiaceae bacterium]